MKLKNIKQIQNVEPLVRLLKQNLIKEVEQLLLSCSKWNTEYRRCNRRWYPSGSVRAMVNDLGRRVKEAGPSTPIEITGLNDVPDAGDRFIVFEDERTARQSGKLVHKNILSFNVMKNPV